MKKPEKKKPWGNKSEALKLFHSGYNDGLEVSDKYHAWNIKTHYIRKDRLPSEGEIEKICNKVHGVEYLENPHTDRVKAQDVKDNNKTVAYAIKAWWEKR